MWILSPWHQNGKTSSLLPQKVMLPSHGWRLLPAYCTDRTLGLHWAHWLAGSIGQHSALSLRHQALGMNLPVSWCRPRSGTHRDRKDRKCGRTPLPYHDTPSIWGAETHPQEQVTACCFAKLLSKKVILISMKEYIFFNVALIMCQALPKPLVTLLLPLTLNNHSVR